MRLSTPVRAIAFMILLPIVGCDEDAGGDRSFGVRVLGAPTTEVGLDTSLDVATTYSLSAEQPSRIEVRIDLSEVDVLAPIFDDYVTGVSGLSGLTHVLGEPQLVSYESTRLRTPEGYEQRFRMRLVCDSEGSDRIHVRATGYFGEEEETWDTTTTVLCTPPMLPDGGADASVDAGVPCSPPSGGPGLITSSGTVESTSNFTGFSAGDAVDGDRTTSWFSAGSSDVTPTFTWTASSELCISSIDFFNNVMNTTPEYRNDFGFDTVTVEIVNAGGAVVWTETRSLAGRPDPDIGLEPGGVRGQSIRLIFARHDDPRCGGFSEISVWGWGA